MKTIRLFSNLLSQGFTSSGRTGMTILREPFREMPMEKYVTEIITVSDQIIHLIFIQQKARIFDPGFLLSSILI
jgi:hypothetical protein